jgi:predicted ATPase/class 3 adenylate cyclase
MTFDELFTQTVELLQREGRVSYRALKRRFALDDEYLEDLKAELIDAKRLAIDEDGKVLVWAGDVAVASSQLSVVSSQPPDALRPTLHAPRSEAERRQLTVMFCDVVGSTALSAQLDPEDFRAVMQAYQQACVNVITRFDGHVAKYLGDGVLAYFGYPTAHEDDAARAVRAGLGIIKALQGWVPSPFQGEGQGEGSTQPTSLSSPHPSLLPKGAREIQVRIGIHTGLVVAGEMGSGEYREQRAIVGETPNIAARLQEQAQPNSVVISAATSRLITGLFELQDLGPQTLKGIATPMLVYQVVRESEAQSRFEVAVRTGLTPLVGRAHEIGLLRERWERTKQGEGQVVLLSGEAGIGKSRLVQELKKQMSRKGATCLAFRCSPYHQNSAFYPIIEHVQRLLQFERDEPPQAKLSKLQQTLAVYRFPHVDTVALLAALLSLPHPEGALPITLSPQKQRQKTQEALVTWLIKEAERTPVYCVWEDLHWADPSTMEVLHLLLAQVPTTRMLTLLTFRPEFTSRWGPRSHITPLTLSRLASGQVEEMVTKVTGGKTLPTEMLQQIVSKTDGVPLFVEELTKSVIETVGAHGHAPLQALSIPATLHDALMARLDKMGAAKEIAQMGATLGREFSYEVLRAISPRKDTELQQALAQLVEAEVLYQRGVLPQAHYLFKHALIQDTAYHSLLKSTRQLYHQQIAQVLEENFSETKESQPELLAHHYTEASLIMQAIPYWQQAGQKAAQRSANVEAINHLTKGLELLKTLPDTPERAQQELTLQIALGVPLVTTKGSAAPEVERTYARARELCQQLGEIPQLFPVLWGLWMFHGLRGELQAARELGEQLLNLAQSIQDPALLLQAHHALWTTAVCLGELASAREHTEQGFTLYNPQQHCSHAFFYGGHDPGVCGRDFAAWALWLLGYPDQALKRGHEALTLARELSYPHSLAYALGHGSIFHQLRREGQAVQELAEAVITLSTEQGFPVPLARGMILRGWALVEQGQREEGMVQLRHGLAAYRATGSELQWPHFLALLAEACGKVGQAEEGLRVLAEALSVIERTAERVYEAELYRLKGELTLQQFKVQGSEFKVPSPQYLTPSTQVEVEQEAEECFHKANEIAREQQAKSLELRAATSLARLWQQQGKHHEARNLLAEVYGWFTEGLDTKDLQEAKALLTELDLLVS